MRILAILGVAAVAAAGCGGSARRSTTVAPGTPPPAGLSGTFQAHLAGDTWRLKVAHGVATLRDRRGAIGLGPDVRITTHGFVVGAKPGCTPGVYTYRITGPTLTFHAVHDGCAHRRTVLTSRPWTRLDGP